MSKIQSAWTAVPNASWGENHKNSFGDSKGFVIVDSQQNNVASVQPYFKQNAEEVRVYAELIASAPVLRKIVRELAGLNPDQFDLDEVRELIEMARDNL
jgi:hypothetical protein